MPMNTEDLLREYLARSGSTPSITSPVPPARTAVTTSGKTANLTEPQYQKLMSAGFDPSRDRVDVSDDGSVNLGSLRPEVRDRLRGISRP